MTMSSTLISSFAILFPDIIDPTERALEVLQDDIDDALFLDRSYQYVVFRLRRIVGNIVALDPKFIDRAWRETDDDLGVIGERILFGWPRSRRIIVVAHDAIDIEELTVG